MKIFDVKQTVKYLKKYGVVKDEDAVRRLANIGSKQNNPRGFLGCTPPPEDQPKIGWQIPQASLDDWLKKYSPNFIAKKMDERLLELEKENLKLKRDLELRNKKIEKLENKLQGYKTKRQTKKKEQIPVEV